MRRHRLISWEAALPIAMILGSAGAADAQDNQPTQPGAGAPQAPGTAQYPGYPQQYQGYPGYPQPAQGAYPGYQQPYPGYGQAPQGYPQPAPAYPTAPQPPAPPAAQPNPPPPALSAGPVGADGKLSFTAQTDEARTLVEACLELVESSRFEAAKAKCTDALAKDASLALAHVLLAQVESAQSTAAGVAADRERVKKRLAQAQEALGKRAPGELERYFVEGLIAQLEDRRPAARAAFDGLAAQLPRERRVYFYRGLQRYRFLDLAGAQTDLQKAVELDPKFGPAYNALGHLALRQERLDDAQKAFEKYVEVAPRDPNAHDSMATMHLRRDRVGPAVDSAKKALELDPKFIKANLRLGDALLFQGNPIFGRRAYAVLIASADPAEHHDAAMRSARSKLFEAQGAPTPALMQEAEKALATEVDAAKKSRRPADQLRALVELGRIQIERGALADAGKTVHAVRDVLYPEEKPAEATQTAAADATPLAPLTEDDRLRFQAELHVLRGLLLFSIDEKVLAEERAAELSQLGRNMTGQQRARELRAELAARAGDRKEVVKLLDPDKAAAQSPQLLATSNRPTARLVLALALSAGKPGEQLDAARARTLMEELSRRNVNDLEGALSKGRAKAWLKQNPAAPPPGATTNPAAQTPAPAAKFE